MIPVRVGIEDMGMQRKIAAYIRKWESQGWANKGEQRANADLWRRLVALDRRLDITFVWVRGHDGSELNERCDGLAVGARMSGPWEVDEGWSKCKNIP